MQSPGLPDILAFLPRGGGLLVVEAKAPRGRLTEEQREFRAACQGCEAPARVYSPKRRQAPVGVRITQRGFGKDRRYPITSRYRPKF